jgi:hypothetical protein
MSVIEMGGRQIVAKHTTCEGQEMCFIPLDVYPPISPPIKRKNLPLEQVEQ